MDETRRQDLLGELEKRVREELERDYGQRRGDPELARLAADYRSYVRMAHPPRRAHRIAEQLLFGMREYQSDTGAREELALAVTATLARIYENWLER